VQSSLVDISGYSILEAMGHGRPVIAFNTGTAREIMEDYRTGRVVERGNVDELANAMAEITEKTDLAREMGRRARERVSEKFNVKTIARKTSGLYHRLLQDMARNEKIHE
jgi:glycosyltransferase involved in cell wall biosynthesis